MEKDKIKKYVLKRLNITKDGEPISVHDSVDNVVNLLEDFKNMLSTNKE